MRTSKHRYGIRGPVVLMIGLSAAICASGASVYIRDPGGTTTSSASQASRSAAGWYEAQADLSSGTFKALSSTQTFTASSSPYVFTYAGIRSLVLTNTSTNSFLDIAVGNLSANFNGTFGFAPSFPAAGSATVQGVVSLSVAKNCLQSDLNCMPSIGGVSFGATASYSSPLSAPAFTSSGPYLTEDGASVTVTQADTTGLQAALRMGPQSLGPGEFLSLQLDVLALASATGGAVATADFAKTATLSLILPDGASWSTDAIVPLTWISTASPVPAPPAAWLMASGLVLLIGLVGRRNRSPLVLGANCVPEFQ